MKKHLGTQQGFSLVELMVVVGIIGLLASIAVPQFQKFQAKARQTEAKSNLSALYSAEKSFFSEYSGYTTSITGAGFAPEGSVKYDVGFVAAQISATTVPGFPVSGDPNIAAGTPFSARTYCGGLTSATKCVVVDGALNGAIGALPVSLGTAVASSSGFVAQARGQILAGGVAEDSWTIDDSKTLINTSSGAR